MSEGSRRLGYRLLLSLHCPIKAGSFSSLPAPVCFGVPTVGGSSFLPHKVTSDKTKQRNEEKLKLQVETETPPPPSLQETFPLIYDPSLVPHFEF